MLKNKVKLIVFDAYGVIFSGGYPDTCAAIARKYKLDKSRVYDILYTKYFNQAALRIITQKEAWEKALRELGISTARRYVEKIHYSTIGVQKRVLALARKLKKDFKIMLLSKNTRTQFHKMKQKFPEVQEIFEDGMINTWEYNLPKAGEKTVKWLCKRMEVRPHEIIYIDDQLINLKTPKEMGLKTILFKNFNQFGRELANYLKN